jgi:hypothetical protein
VTETVAGWILGASTPGSSRNSTLKWALSHATCHQQWVDGVCKKCILLNKECSLAFCKLDITGKMSLQVL